MNWFKISQQKIDQDAFNKKIKEIIKTDRYLISLFEQFDIPIDYINDKLTFIITELKDKHSEANDKEIRINSNLFETGNFFKDNFHFIVHELIHWLHRQSEQKWYFNDFEEVQSFAAAIAWELHQNHSLESIKIKILPIVRGHFKNDKDAEAFFELLKNKALRLLKSF